MLTDTDQIIYIDFALPDGWSGLSDRQLKFLYELVAEDFSADEIKLLCLLRWSGTKVIGKQPDGSFLLKKGKSLFSVSALAVAEILSRIDWLAAIPPSPVRINKIRRLSALPADFSEVPFEKFIMADNLYQGYLATKDDSLLDELASVLYGRAFRLSAAERVNVFFWLASLKDFFARRFPDFFQPVGASTDGNLLGSASPNIEEAMNAQIRALTKGDITKEKEILSLDTWRALTELNAQAKEYKLLNSKLKSK